MANEKYKELIINLEAQIKLLLEIIKMKDEHISLKQEIIEIKENIIRGLEIKL